LYSPAITTSAAAATIPPAATPTISSSTSWFSAFHRKPAPLATPRATTTVSATPSTSVPTTTTVTAVAATAAAATIWLKSGGKKEKDASKYKHQKIQACCLELGMGTD